MKRILLFSILVLVIALAFTPMLTDANTKTVSGTITKVEGGDGSVGTTIKISIGSNKNLKEGDLGWVSKGSENIAYIKILSVDRNSSVAIVTVHENVNKVTSGLSVGFKVKVSEPKPESKPKLQTEKMKVTEKEISIKDDWGYLGVILKEINPELAGYYGLYEEKGAIVFSIDPGSPAEIGGLLCDDIIITYDGEEVTSAHELTEKIVKTTPTKKISIVLYREGEKKEVTLKIETIPEKIKYVKIGDGFLKKGDTEKAIGAYSRALDIDPEYREALINRSFCYCILERYDDAFSDINKFIEIYPDDDVGYRSRGTIYKQMGKNTDAVKEYTKAINLNPDSAINYMNRGNTYQKSKKYRKAIEDLTKAIDIEPNLARLYYDRGTNYDWIDKHEKAISDFSKAISIEPDNASYYYRRGYRYLDKDVLNYYNAISDFTMAIKIYPDFASAYVGRGFAYDRLGIYNKAYEDFKKGCELGSTVGCKNLELLRKR